MRILCMIGTRPEAIKMAPLILLLKSDPHFECFICSTSQHEEILESAMKTFGIVADFKLWAPKTKQSLCGICAHFFKKIEPVIAISKPDLILVQGDTTTAFIGALAGFYLHVPVGHIEAGLRTHEKHEPFPEEINRQFISRIADYHFAPTMATKQNLIHENIPESKIFITGNTVIDALKMALDIISQKQREWSDFGFSNPGLFANVNNQSKKLILVTTHRRENIHSGILKICHALNKLAERDDVFILVPLHPNPEVKARVQKNLIQSKNIHLVNPLDYLSFVYLMKNCYFIITDSGGIQEEASYLGIPVLVARGLSDREESIIAGIAKLTPPGNESIYSKAVLLLDNRDEYQKMAIPDSIYGDGKASERIVSILKNLQLATN